MVAPLALALVVAASMCTAAISSLEGSAVIADYVFRFRSISGGYASLQCLASVALADPIDESGPFSGVHQ